MVHNIVFFRFQIPQRMRLNKEQRIEIIPRAGSGRSRMVADAFNRRHGTNITHETVAKLIGKHKNWTCNRSSEMRSKTYSQQ